MNLFGKRKPSHSKPAAKPGHTAPRGNTPPTQTAVMSSLEQMRETVANLEKRQAYLTKKAATHLGEAASLKATDKTAALLALKRYKLITVEVERLVNTQTSLEAQILSIESASMTSGIVQSVQVGMTTQKALQKNLNPEAVAMLHEDVVEQMDALDEINRTLGTPMGDPFDEDDLARQLDELTVSGVASAAPAQQVNLTIHDDSEELQALERDILSDLPSAPTATPMPSVPISRPVVLSKTLSSNEEDDEELARLAREMEG